MQLQMIVALNRLRKKSKGKKSEESASERLRSRSPRALDEAAEKRERKRALEEAARRREEAATDANDADDLDEIDDGAGVGT